MAATRVIPKFWKPGTEAPGVGEERATPGEEASTAFVYNPHISLSIQQQRQRLPIFMHRNHVLYLVEKYRTVVIVGETGCGKSTQIPQYLAEAGWTAEGHVVAITQPRRVAATTVAARVAEERGALLGHEVGYCIRFDDCSDPQATRIKFLTDGMLVREMMADPLLKKYSPLLLRFGDTTAPYPTACSSFNRSLVEVTSSTIPSSFSRAFECQCCLADYILWRVGQCTNARSYILMYPVPDYVKTTVETIMKIHNDAADGDILAFLTGQEEVENVVSAVVEEVRAAAARSKGSLHRHVRALPMYAGLPYVDQMKVFERVGRNCRKVVVATNVAETSVTVPGIAFVVDCGFVKLRTYDPRRAVDALLVTPASRASAQQRAGRAGRSRPGKCYRLYPESEFAKLPEATEPEMRRSDMAPVILQLKALGIDNVLRFSFLSPPPAESMVQAVELLYALGGAWRDASSSSPLGVRMAEFPMGPMYAKMLLESGTFGCSKEIITIAAMMQIQNVFLSPPNQKIKAARQQRKFAVEEGDHMTMLNVFEAFVKHNKSSAWCQQHFLNYKGLVRAGALQDQLRKLLRRFHIPSNSSNGTDPKLPLLTWCILTSAKATGFGTATKSNTANPPHPLCTLPALIGTYQQHLNLQKIFSIIHQRICETTRSATIYSGPAWLTELAPHFFQQSTHPSGRDHRSGVSRS
uniref:RNA helicase n=1 Tax=Petromyzon marinus TaxID=7757 RepID=S4RH71_PETMA